ncbi:MAG: MGMT family protein [Acidiferrobacterales bacterium]
MPSKAREGDTLYARIYTVVRSIPHGHVATYGQIAAIAGRCTARTVGFAMAAVPGGSDIPWHRVINREGRISERRYGGGSIRQRHMLEAEGVYFDRQNRVDFARFGWRGF